MRKDLTISLDENHINELLEVAETQNITLSALIRTIVASYLQSARDGTAFIQPGAMVSGDEEIEPAGSSLLSETVAYHGKLIDEIQRRITALESGMIKPGIQTSFACPVPEAPGISGVIDTDIPVVSGLSDEALVKLTRQQVAPVMDAMEMGSMKIRLDKEYSQTEAAVALGVSVSTMRKYIKGKKIKARKVGRSWLIHGKDILDFQSMS